jgi:teichoic acid transport system permease protein
LTAHDGGAEVRTSSGAIDLPQHPLVVPTDGAVPEPLGPLLPSEGMRAIAEASGLRQMGVRPPLGEYVRSVWARRAFIRELGSGKAYARNQGSYLGQAWAVLNPLLNAMVYVVIFGFVMHTTRDTANGIAFIVVGTFIYRFFDASVSAGAKSIKANMSLVRSVHFPRASLPISSVVTEAATLAPAIGVMLVVSWLSGFIPGYAPVPITWRLLLLPVAIGLMWMFNTGMAFIAARLVAITPDIENVIPFLLRFVMYGSGVLFSISHFVHQPGISHLMQYQPVAVYLYLCRAAVLNEPSIPIGAPSMWIAGVVWALLFLVGGFLYFWRSEQRYGRD